MTPSIGLPGATDDASAERLRWLCAAPARWETRASAAGALPAASASHSRSTSSSAGNISAKGFSSRCLRWRSLRTASSLRASTIRWKPPSPLTPTILPCADCLGGLFQCRTRDAPAPRPSCSRAQVVARTPGRRWAVREICGSPGSRYSRAHSAHMVNFFIVVRGRS